MSYYGNPYYDPTTWGWKIIDSIDYGKDCSFDIYAFFKDVNGDVRFGADAGCSCPSPFEGFNGPGAFELLTKQGWSQVKSEMRRRVGDGYVTHDDVQRIVHKVEEALRAGWDHPQEGELVPVPSWGADGRPGG